MGIVTGIALSPDNRRMLVLVSFGIGFDIVMAFAADFSRRIFQETGLVGSMRTVADGALSVGKRRMGSVFFFGICQILMAGQAKLALVCRDLEEA